MAMKDRWVQAEVNDILERRLSPNPLVTIHKYPGADHAFARHGGKTYSKPEAERALGAHRGLVQKASGLNNQREGRRLETGNATEDIVSSSS